MIYQTALQPRGENGWFTKQHYNPEVKTDDLPNSTTTQRWKRMIYQTELKPMCETGYFNKQHLKPSVESDVLTNSTKAKGPNGCFDKQH
jgi:hypothetical protein